MTPPMSFKSRSKSGKLISDTRADLSVIALATGVVCSVKLDLVYTTKKLNGDILVSGGMANSAPGNAIGTGFSICDRVCPVKSLAKYTR